MLCSPMLAKCRRRTSLSAIALCLPLVACRSFSEPGHARASEDLGKPPSATLGAARAFVLRLANPGDSWFATIGNVFQEKDLDGRAEADSSDHLRVTVGYGTGFSGKTLRVELSRSGEEARVDASTWTFWGDRGPAEGGGAIRNCVVYVSTLDWIRGEDLCVDIAGSCWLQSGEYSGVSIAHWRGRIE